jgi:hypothetical protein
LLGLVRREDFAFGTTLRAVFLVTREAFRRAPVEAFLVSLFLER